jgi:hypothetical protein
MTAPKDADKLHKQLSTLISAIKWLRRRQPELAEKVRHVIEPRLDAEAEKRKSAYHAYLAKLQIKRGTPIALIEPLARDPKLRRLHEKREITAEIARLFRWLL